MKSSWQYRVDKYNVRDIGIFKNIIIYMVVALIEFHYVLGGWPVLLCSFNHHWNPNIRIKPLYGYQFSLKLCHLHATRWQIQTRIQTNHPKILLAFEETKSRSIKVRLKFCGYSIYFLIISSLTRFIINVVLLKL